jgi:hypothetical protein
MFKRISPPKAPGCVGKSQSRRGPPKKKLGKKCGKIAEIAENCGKLRFFSKGNCGRELEKFRFPWQWKRKFSVSLKVDRGKKRRRKNYNSKPSQNPAENIISHICGHFSQNSIKNGCS